MRFITKVIGESFYILRKNSKLFVPFLIGGLFNALALYLVYLIPQRPFLYVFGPPVRAFFGEKFLHYPFNLYLLPKLFYYATSFVSATVGVLMTATAIGMIRDIYYKKRPLIRTSLFYALRRYFSLFCVWLVVFVLMFTFGKFMRSFKSEGAIAKLLPYFVYLGIIFIQLIFIYVIPVLVINNKNIIKSFAEGIAFLRKVFLPTVTILGLAILVYLPVFILKQNLPFLSSVFYPEIIVVIFAIGVFVSFIIDIFVTTVTTFIFLEKKGGG